MDLLEVLVFFGDSESVVLDESWEWESHEGNVLQEVGGHDEGSSIEVSKRKFSKSQISKSESEMLFEQWEFSP